MERTVTGVPERKKVRYRKIGGGSLRFQGRIIKPNQKFDAYPDEIPEAFLDLITPLEDTPDPKVEPALDVETKEYTVKHQGGGWYNILDSDGKKMNEKALKKDQAEAMLESLK